MENTVRISSDFTVKMYSHNARIKKIVDIIDGLWKEFVQYERQMLLDSENIEQYFTEEEIDKLKNSNGEFSEGTLADYITMMDWFYIVWCKNKPIGYMATVGTTIYSLYIKEEYRENKLGKFLVFNHHEIFNTDLTLSCYLANESALNAYLRMGFKAEQASENCVLMELKRR